VLAANRWALGRVTRDPTVVRHLRAIRRAQLHSARLSLGLRASFDTGTALERYLALRMAHLPEEQCRVFYVDAAGHLIREELAAKGCVDHCVIEVRQILVRALELGATGLIVAHNHPSGDPWPSPDDLAVTAALEGAARQIGVHVHDHIIVAAGGVQRMRKTKKAGDKPGLSRE
jgi:DNA repair protein RadC